MKFCKDLQGLTAEEQETLDLMFDHFFHKLVYAVQVCPAKAHALTEFEAMKTKVFGALQKNELH